MGSLTSSLLASSTDKRAEDAEAMAKQSDGSSGAKATSPAQPGKGASSSPDTQKKLPGAGKMAAIGAAMGSFKKGGTVPKTGPYLVHEGEEVIPAKRASEYRKVFLGRKSKKD